MLRGLDIRDMLIIDRLELEFQSGLNVLTGETGAGKSILLDSLGFVLGWRGRAELVRAGAAQGEVTAWFDLEDGHPARAVLREAGLPVADELILRRVNTADGRKTAWVNDRRTSGEVLRQLSSTLVELHGQHDDRGLLNPRGHRELLDEFAGAAGALDAVRAAWTARRTAAQALDAAEQRIAGLRAEEDFLRHAVKELEALAPEPGEDAELDARRRLMQAAERVREDIARAHEAVAGQGAEGLVSDALRWIDGAAEHVDGRLDAPSAALGRALEALAEAEQGIADCVESLAFDPSELDRVADRLFAIREMARKHKVQPDDLADRTDVLRSKLAALDAGAGDLADLKAAKTAAEAEHAAACDRLSEIRRTAAKRLDAAMAVELAPLKMERAVFTTEITPADPGPDGQDAVQFTVATNPGAPSGPLNRIASGGELSRFLLALKVCLMGESHGMTMIFDEIDRGVGGATADAVGRRLATLAERAQVLIVTHSPQVAALGGHHWRVEKRVAGDATLSTVTPLDPAARVDELARMLAGDRVTEEARAAARALLDR
ncbi:DNA repair protein RecN [Tropicimonas isoalkanivorans]|uniref:DNA repair protein RecN n=1 Tax=Tropicimonas isoalkanivorans TaxID=441112 RepID=A0A1I1G8V7_9RHOB|nr:DNA repair protein RecN [Tropicimonas isoalkanivorans]SFC06278.1 DNA replication and repair protein RecN [Tropicimonas isoalkanivorans]